MTHGLDHTVTGGRGTARPPPPAVRGLHPAGTAGAAERDTGGGHPCLPGVRPAVQRARRGRDPPGRGAHPGRLRGPGGQPRPELGTAGRTAAPVRPGGGLRGPRPGDPAERLPARRPHRAAPRQDGGTPVQPLPRPRPHLRGRPLRVRRGTRGDHPRGVRGGAGAERVRGVRVTKTTAAPDPGRTAAAPGDRLRTVRGRRLGAAPGVHPRRPAPPGAPPHPGGSRR